MPSTTSRPPGSIKTNGRMMPLASRTKRPDDADAAPAGIKDSKSMIKAVKGTRDILPPSSAAWNQVEAISREVFRQFNYHEIRTPILEETALFARGVGEETDIVSKEMYTFDDRDGSSLTLRPEATASVMRAYIEHRLDRSEERRVGKECRSRW